MGWSGFSGTRTASCRDSTEAKTPLTTLKRILKQGAKKKSEARVGGGGAMSDDGGV